MHEARSAVTGPLDDIGAGNLALHRQIGRRQQAEPAAGFPVADRPHISFPLARNLIGIVIRVHADAEPDLLELVQTRRRLAALARLTQCR